MSLFLNIDDVAAADLSGLNTNPADRVRAKGHDMKRVHGTEAAFAISLRYAAAGPVCRPGATPLPLMNAPITRPLPACSRAFSVPCASWNASDADSRPPPIAQKYPSTSAGGGSCRTYEA